MPKPERHVAAQIGPELGSGIIAARSLRARVLVIDDEPHMVRIMGQLLEPDHAVALETSGAAALARIEAGEWFDVILCDVMMPEMSGPAFYAQLRRVRPALAQRVVFITGGAFTPQAEAFVRAVPNATIEKPFDVRDLRAIVLAAAYSQADPKPPP
jgi:CheY-like chemotaxis protein